MFNYRNVTTHVVPPATIQQTQLAFFWMLIIMTLAIFFAQVLTMLATLCQLKALNFADVSATYKKPTAEQQALLSPDQFKNHRLERKVWFGCGATFNNPLDLCYSCSAMAGGGLDSYLILEFSRVTLAFIGLICALVEIAATTYCIIGNIPPLPGLDGINAVSYIGFALAFYPLSNPGEKSRTEKDVLDDLKLAYNDDDTAQKTRSHYTLFMPYITTIVLCIGVVLGWMGMQNQMQNDPAYISLPSVTGTYHIQQSNITLFGTDQAGFNFVTTHYKVTTLLSSILATLCLASLGTVLFRANCTKSINWKGNSGISGFKSN